MTNKELQDLLKQYPDDAQIRVETSYCNDVAEHVRFEEDEYARGDEPQYEIIISSLYC